MIKKKIKKKDNVINFPSKLSSIEKEIEGIVFAAAEPLDIDTIESKISKKTDVEKVLNKLQSEYSGRGINLVCISCYFSNQATKSEKRKPFLNLAFSLQFSAALSNISK